MMYSFVLMLVMWGILGYSMHRDRSRYRNCYLLFMAILVSIPVVIGLMGPFSGIVVLLLLFGVMLAFFVVPVLLIKNGIDMLRKEGRSFQNLLSLIMGIGCLIGILCVVGFWVYPISVAFGHDGWDIFYLNVNWPWVMLLVSGSFFYFGLSYLAFMVYTLFLEVIPRKRDFDYVIIHGAGLIHGNQVSKLLAERIDKAIEIYHKDPTPPILIPSGGQGGDETIAEGDAMAQYLYEHGIPKEHVLIENSSKTTMENLINSKKLIEEREGRKYIALVTSNFHVYRAIRYAKKIGLVCTGIGAHVAGYYWPSALIREYVAIHKNGKHLYTLILGWIVLVVLPLLFLRFHHVL